MVVYNIDLTRQEIVDLNDLEVLNYYDNLCQTYDEHPDGFDNNVGDNPNYPRMWYIQLIRKFLDLFAGTSRILRIKYTTIIYKINIKFITIFECNSFRTRYRETTIIKAHDILQQDGDIITIELKNVLQHFLDII